MLDPDTVPAQTRTAIKAFLARSSSILTSGYLEILVRVSMRGKQTSYVVKDETGNYSKSVSFQK
jgi:hypothetical protein